MLKIFIDFDSTLVETNKRVVEILNANYNLDKTEDDVKDYNYQSIYPISESEKKSIFESDVFFNGLKFKPGALDFISKYKNMIELVICTSGTKKNIDLKKEFIKNSLLNLEIIGVLNTIDKSSIDMTNGIQIDDNICSLNTNANLKILYKDFRSYYWQKNNNMLDLYEVNTWEEIENIIDFYIINEKVWEV